MGCWPEREPVTLAYDNRVPVRLTRVAANRAPLDTQAEQDLAYLAYLAAKYGTQTAAVKSALAVLADRDRMSDRMQAVVDDVEQESGPLTDEELDAGRRYFR